MLKVPAFRKRQFCTSPLLIRMRGLRTPLMRNGGSLLVMMATSREVLELAGRGVVDRRLEHEHVLLRGGDLAARRRSAPSMISMPAMPLPTCIALEPCRCGWYQ